MRKPVFCICENKGADQLRGNCTADQRLCFPYIDNFNAGSVLGTCKFPKTTFEL